MEKGRSKFFIQLFSTRFDSLVHSLPLAGADEPSVSFRIWPLRSLQPGWNVSAPGSHNQWLHDNVGYCRQLQIRSLEWMPQRRITLLILPFPFALAIAPSRKIWHFSSADKWLHLRTMSFWDSSILYSSWFSRKPKPRGCQAAAGGANSGRPRGSLR